MTPPLRRALLAVLAVTTISSIEPARGQPTSLECYKIKDTLRMGGTADLDTPQFGVDPGCKISKAKLFCVPAGKEILGAIDRATGINRPDDTLVLQIANKLHALPV